MTLASLPRFPPDFAPSLWSAAMPEPHASHGSKSSRRSFLQTTGLGAVSLLWTDWLRAEAVGAGTTTAKAKRVILIFNAGAPSHIDLWDMKPNAPENVRGTFKPIATNVTGV